MLPFCELLIVEDIPPNTERGGVSGDTYIHPGCHLAHLGDGPDRRSHPANLYIPVHVHVSCHLTHLEDAPYRRSHPANLYISVHDVCIYPISIP